MNELMQSPASPHLLVKVLAFRVVLDQVGLAFE